MDGDLADVNGIVECMPGSGHSRGGDSVAVGAFGGSEVESVNAASLSELESI